MEVLKFNLSGKTAFFKKPDVNSYFYFTYGNIHKIAMLGIIGAVLGLRGYNFQGAENYPEFYRELSGVNIAIVPKNDRGYIFKKVQIFNNSIGYASQEEGGNLIIKEQWLEEPEWDIYVILDESVHGKNIKDKFLNYSFAYIPYLGKNDHFANIKDIKTLDLEEIKSADKIDSLFLKSYFEFSNVKRSVFDDDSEYDEHWKYEERLPVALEQITNQYITDSCVFTNMNVRLKKEHKLYVDGEKVLFFL